MTKGISYSRLLVWLNRHYMYIVSVFVLLVYGMTYMAQDIYDPIRSDGAGYYAYLPSFVLYGDPSYQRDAEVRYGGEFPRWTYVREYPPTGRYLNSLNIGMSVMTLPFFLIAHVLTAWFGFPWQGGHEFLQMRFAPDGYSFFYQHAAGLAGVFYFLVGFALLRRMLSALYTPGVVMAAMTVVLLGTNLLYYGAIGSFSPHAFTFMLAAMLMKLTAQWYAAPNRWGANIGIGVVAALLFLVRPLNVVMLLWPVLYGLKTRSDWMPRGRLWIEQSRSLGVMAVAAFLVMVPQFLIWKYSSGHFIVKAYQHMGTSDFGVPDLPEFFIGVQNGMFLWFPVFFFAYAGLWPLWRRSRGSWSPVAALLLAYPLVITSYQGWLTAGGFGNRYVVDMAPFMIFPIVALYASVRSMRLKILLAIISMLFVVWTLFLLTLMLRLEIGNWGLDRQALFDIFWWRKDAFLRWWDVR